MSYNEVSWEFPQYSVPSIFNFAVSPGVCWNALQNSPFISAFEVQYLDLEDGIWTPIGTTATNFIRFPADVDVGNAVYQIRVATIGTDGTRSPWSFSIVTLSSPLAFDFTTSQTVRLADGTEVPNQRYLFLVL
jgi:hypothetical protein